MSRFTSSARVCSALALLLVGSLSARPEAQSPTAFERQWQAGTPVIVTGSVSVVYGDDFVNRRSEVAHWIRDEVLTERYGNRRRAAMEFERACGLGFSAGCDNAITQGNTFRRDAPTVGDYEFLLRGSKGPFADREPAKLYARACDQGWPDAFGIQ